MEVVLLGLRLILWVWGVWIAIRKTRISIPVLLALLALVLSEFAPPLIIHPTVPRTAIYDARWYFSHESIVRRRKVESQVVRRVREVTRSTNATLEDVRRSLREKPIFDPYNPGAAADVAWEKTAVRIRVRDKDLDVVYDPTNGIHSKGVVEYTFDLKRLR